MELHYQITREQYEKAVEALLRQRQKNPMSIGLLLLMTLGQFGFVLYCILRYQTSPGQTALLIALSLSICAIQVFYRCTVSLRARSQTARAVQKGQIQEDFWKKQRLTLKDDLVTLRCGKTELSYDCAYFSGTSRAGDMLLLLFARSGAVHQLMVPDTAFASSEERDAFEEALRTGKKRSVLAGMEKARSPRPENAEYALEYRYTSRNFSRDQIHAVRMAYTSRIGWPLSQIARLAAAAFLLYHLIAGSYGSTGMIVFIALILLVLLYPLLISFTPLCRLIVRRNTRSLFVGLDELRCSLDVVGQELFYQGDSFENTLRLNYLYDVVERKPCTILYWKDNTVITIPAAVAKTSEARRMVSSLRAIADRNWAARKGKDLLR